jgi:3-oxoacyl-[acyl-carrier-protein] synthase II
MLNSKNRRVVITGIGVISPIGSTPESLWSSLDQGHSAVGKIQSMPAGSLPVVNGAEATAFTGDIEQFGPLDKQVQRAIRKGQKLMCREIEMGVAVAQLALHHANLTVDQRKSHRTGVVYGCDYIMTMPEEFCEGIRKCTGKDNVFRFDDWAASGLPQVNPLWLLKYLPNMPASHIAIYNDLQGPNNSLTLREASSCAAIIEAFCTIERGHADVLVVGATGTRIHPFKSLHAAMQETLAADREDPTTMSRPFEKDRNGSVLGEGAAAIILEELEHAEKRGAQIWGEISGFGSSAVGVKSGLDFQRTAIRHVAKKAVGTRDPASIGHINAHGIGTLSGDLHEANGIADVFGPVEKQPPLVAAKSYFGNLGAGSGMVEIIASLMAMKNRRLFRTLNYDQADPECKVRPVTGNEVPAGDSFVKLSITPQGQASAVLVSQFT